MKYNVILSWSINLRRLHKILLGSSFSLLVGLIAGTMSGNAYEHYYYPNDIDPVDFTIGGIFLGVWFSVWFVGSIAVIWWTGRGYMANRPEN